MSAFQRTLHLPLWCLISKGDICRNIGKLSVLYASHSRKRLHYRHKNLGARISYIKLYKWEADKWKTLLRSSWNDGWTKKDCQFTVTEIYEKIFLKIVFLCLHLDIYRSKYTDFPNSNDGYTSILEMHPPGIRDSGMTIRSADDDVCKPNWDA
jgi:hypothetical protein